MTKAGVAGRLIGSGAAIVAGSAGISHAQDVSGFYGGLGVGANAGDFIAFGDEEYSFEGGPVTSLFVGYNVVSGNLVYGGELAWTNKAEFSDNPYVGHATDIIDLKGRVGTMVGNTLVYGALGYSMGDVEVDWDGASGGDVSGFSIGAGFETNITENVYLGGDFTNRQMDGGGTINGLPGELYMDDVNLSTISIRLGFRF
mgnify:CR=1 FL=1